MIAPANISLNNNTLRVFVLDMRKSMCDVPKCDHAQ